MKYSEKKRRMAAKILAILLIAAMVLTSGYYILMIFARNTALDCLAVYGEDALDSRDSLERLDGIEDFIDFIHSFYKDEVSYEVLVDAAYNGIVDSLGDPWSVYYVTTEESDSFVQTINQEYSGIGVTMQMDANRCLITDVNKKGPAYEAGIHPGTYITAIDGKSTQGMSLSEMSEKIRGLDGTSVTITVDDNGVESQFKVVRRKVRVATINCEMLEGNMGYISLSSFGEDTGSEFTEARLSLLNQGAEGLIIDIRDNGGGYVSTALTIADDLIDEGILSRFVHRGEDLVVYEATPDLTRKVPTVLLVNEYSASASEILAAALKDNGTAILVGNTTYGKGVAQIIQELDHNDAVKLSVYYFQTPDGNDINGVGIEPDYIVPASKYTEEEAASIKSSVVPMAEEKKYYAGQYGLNVLAAQQRLFYLGYDVQPTAKMDEKTVAAIKAFQPTFGGSPYGGLDFCTQKAICEAFEALFAADPSDPQLLKAIELLTK